LILASFTASLYCLEVQSTSLPELRSSMTARLKNMTCFGVKMSIQIFKHDL
jgi:hypothetical protein